MPGAPAPPHRPEVCAGLAGVKRTGIHEQPKGARTMDEKENGNGAGNGERYIVSVVVKSEQTGLPIMRDELARTPDMEYAKEYARAALKTEPPVQKSDPANVRALILAWPEEEEQACVFTKRSNGKERRMVFQTKPPEEYLKENGGNGGRERSYDPAEKALINVWDLEKADFRMIPLDAVLTLEQGGEVVFEVGPSARVPA